MRIKKKVLQKIVSVFASVLLLVNAFTPYLLIVPTFNSVKAQEETVTPTSEPTPTDVVSPAPTVEPTLAPIETATPTPTVEVTSTETPTTEPILVPTETPTPTPTSAAEVSTEEVSTATPTPTVIPEPTPIQTPSQWTFEKVELNKEYVAPQNSEVKLTFTKLPNPAGSIKIEEITLTEDQIKQTGSLSNKAYDITSDMKDGDFSYNLSLPIPESSKGKAVEVKFAEEISNIGSAEKVENELTKTDTSVSVASLDHMTIFVVTVVVLKPDYAAPGGGGIYSAYYGPPSHIAVSPGSTSIYDGREAGIIKAGQGTNPGSSNWDEGLFAFKPTVTIDTFATSPVTYDVQNEVGVNPVWMTIEIDTGIINDRSDNVTYQFVPTSNPTGWHTVDAATGSWQRWNDGAGDTTGNPLLSLSAIAIVHSGLNVVRTYLRLGMGDSYYNGGTGTIAWVDKATFGEETYDFSITSATTNDATGITSNNATLNGFNKSDATGHSFWVSLAPFVTTSSTIPAGVYSSPDLGSIVANTDFSVSLSSITTTGVPSNLPAITPGTTYYFAAWSSVGGTWYPGEIKTFTTDNGPVFIDTNINGILDSGELSFNTIQDAIIAATSGDSIHVTAGTYTEVGQIVINKNISIIGADKTTTIIKPAQNTTNSSDGRGWILVDAGNNFSLKNVTLDGSGKLIDIAILSHGTGTIDNNIIKNMGYGDSSSLGRGIAVYDANMTITNNFVQNYGRIGIYMNGTSVTSGLVEGNTIEGKGTGSHLDYGVEVENSAVVDIKGNIISNNKGVAGDGSTSAGIYATTYFASGTTVMITNNTIYDNSYGVAIGYTDDSSYSETTSVPQFTGNTFTNNTIDLDLFSTNNVDARNNTWSVTDQDNLDQIEAKINHYCSSSTYVHGVCNGAIDYSRGIVQYKNIGTPTNSGWNLQSKSATPNETPLDLACSTNTVYTNENSLAQNWSLVDGTNIKYQREVTFPSSVITNFEAGSNTYTPFSSFGSGPGTEGLWKTRVRAYVDANSNNTYDSGEEVSDWSNQCKITYDKTVPTVPINGTPNGTSISTNNFDFNWDDSADNTPITYIFQSTQNPASSGDVLTTGLWTSGTLPTSMIHSSGAGDGKWYWQIKAKDAAGNESAWSQIWNVTLDTIAPAVPGNPSPANQSFLNTHDFIFSWDAVSDPSTPISYEWEFSYGTTVKGDGSFTSRSGFHSLASASVNSPGTPDNIYYWHIRAIDLLGNASAWSPTWKVTVDTAAPTTPAFTPAAGDYTSDQSVTLASSDSGSGLASIYYTIDGSTPNNTKTHYVGAITVNHDMTIKAIAYDNAGNLSDILEAVYGIAPKISSEASSLVTSTTATVTWTTDDLSTSRVIYDTVSHPGVANPTFDDPFDKYGYANTTDEFDTLTKVTSHSVGLTGLTAGTTYYYRTVSHGSPETVSAEHNIGTTSFVSTTNGGGGTATSMPSAPVCNDQKPGNAPFGLTAVAGLNSVTLTWNKASDPVSYYLMTFGTTSGSQTYGNPNIGNKDTTSYTVSGLSGGTTYYFKVRAGNGCMPGDFSNEASAAPSGGFIEGVPAGFEAGVLGEATKSAELTEELTGEPTPTTTVINAGLVKGIESIAKNKFSKYILPIVLIILLTAVIFYFYKKKNS